MNLEITFSIITDKQDFNLALQTSIMEDKKKRQLQLNFSKYLENTSSDCLISEKGIDYLRLQDLLKQKKWKEADYETYLMMLLVMNRKEGDWLKNDEFLNFPYADLRTIDRLWIKYSNGQFGFSVQKEIYLSVGGKPDGRYCEEAWKRFKNQVGWIIDYSRINHSQIIFDTSAPQGHLPQRWTTPLLPGARGFYLVCVSALVARLVNCDL